MLSSSRLHIFAFRDRTGTNEFGGFPFQCRVALQKWGEMTEQTTRILKASPTDAKVFKAFSKYQALCDDDFNQEHTVPAEMWIDVGIDWSYEMRTQCPNRSMHTGIAMALAIYVSPLTVGDHKVAWTLLFERDVDDG